MTPYRTVVTYKEAVKIHDGESDYENLMLVIATNTTNTTINTTEG